MEIFQRINIQIIWKYFRIFIFFASCAIIFLFFLLAAIYGLAKLAGPPPIEVPQSTVYYGSDGSVIGESNSDGQRRYWVELDDISPWLIKATIAAEDQRFFKHIGFDFKRIGGAILADIRAMAKVQGASTISQQYARNLFLSHEKTWKRKIKEAIYTIRIEANYSKDEILEGYLNTIYYGHGAYGVEAASQYYFNKSAKDLNLSEAAMLAGVPKGPSSFSPFVSLEKAENRQKTILTMMAEQGIISKEEAVAAADETILLVGQANTLERDIAPYFQDVVRNQLKEQLGIDERTISLGGLRVYTTLDAKMQKSAEETFTNTIAEESFIQGALVAMDPVTGHVKALVGGRDYKESSYNRAVYSLRQPGSTLKPILYLAALEHGFTPATTLKSELTTFTFNNGQSEYTPKNFNYKYADDEITMLKALALSDNVYAVKTHLFLGMDTLADYAEKLGIQSEQQAVPSLALGTSGVRVIELANAYSHFANGGKSVEPIFITKVTDRNGEVLYEHEQKSSQIIDPDYAFVMNHLLTAVFDSRLNDYANVTGETIIPKASRIYSGKSGSTKTDSWMIGYTPELVTAVWTGYDKGKDITLYQERQYAKNIWIDFMELALADKPMTTFKPTEGVVGVSINPDNGLIATEACPESRLTYFIKGTEPQEYCTEQSPDEENTDEEKAEEHLQEEKPWYKKIFDWF